MADGSAAILLDVLLTRDVSAPGSPLAAALAGDPPLLLWTLCAADRSADREEALRPRRLEDVAQWLARHAVDVLRWDPAEQVASGGPRETSPEAWADRVAGAVEVACLAEQLAAAAEPPLAESAFLLGLLSDAGGLLAMASAPPTADPDGCLPGWLVATGDRPAGVFVGRAAEMLAGGTPPADSAAIDLGECRRRAAEARRRWLAPVECLGDWLPSLAARLSRLTVLEGRFQQQLETEKLEAMAEFAAGAGHEINNPLTIIAGRAQLFLRDEEDPERRRALALISAQAMRVYEMIADMMLFARPPKPEPAAIDLGQLVDRLIEEMAPEAARQEIGLRRTGQPGPVEIEADATQLTVALRAVCQNALDAIGRQGHIEIDVGPSGREVAIRVADDGPGIPADQRRHVFDPYYSARQAGRGLGLGLSKAWRIVTNHGGRIELDRRPEHGAVFTLLLPRRQP